jgi:hypothetical protein
MIEAPADDPFDYGSDADPDQAVVARAFAELDTKTLALERGQAEQKRIEELLDRIKKSNEQLANKDIPDLLASMRLDKCTTSSGIEVTVKRDIKASLPGHDRIEARLGALRWLIDHGHGGVIKNVVTVDLDRGEDARADELVIELRAKGFEPIAKKDVHAQTLGALVRELMAEGTIVPKENFNLFDMKIAKLSRKQ